MRQHTYREILAQHYVDSPIELYSEFRDERHGRKGLFVSDVDDTLELDGTSRLIDLLFGRIAYYNERFKNELPGIKKDIELMYETRDARASMRSLSSRFRNSRVTRKQFEDASKWTVENYIINPTFRDFVTKDLTSLGLEFVISTANFDKPLQLLASRLGIELNVLNCSSILYEECDGEEIVKEIYGNVMMNKKLLNEDLMREKGTAEGMLITMAENPSFEPYFPISAGLAIWVDPSAREVQSSARVNLYIPDAKRDIRKLTGRIRNWKMAMDDSSIDSEEKELEVIDAVVELKKAFNEIRTERPESVPRISQGISAKAEPVIKRVERHRPRLAREMRGYATNLTRQFKSETLREYAKGLEELVKTSIPEYYNTEILKESLMNLTRGDEESCKMKPI